MMLSIADVLTSEQVAECRQAFEQASWQDGRITAGHQAVMAKSNQQLALDDPLAQQIGDFIVQRLSSHPQFVSAALPLKVLPPRFNRYSGGGTYGNHIDNSIFSVPGTSQRVRSDLSATLFFSDPDEYDGGELVVEDSYGSHSVKLSAGHLVLYPGSSLHRVNSVTRGTRYAAFFWIQSLVRDDTQRSLLLELDRAVQALTHEVPESAELARLTGVYHNLLRQWANT